MIFETVITSDSSGEGERKRAEFTREEIPGMSGGYFFDKIARR
jgi:hypothetical protein